MKIKNHETIKQKYTVTSTPFTVDHYDPVGVAVECAGKASTFIKVGNVIGQGAFGEVRVGIMKGTKERVALKYIDKDQSVKHNIDLTTEGKMLRKLGLHPNILRFCGLYENDESTFFIIVTEFAKGGDLYNLLKGARPGENALDVHLPPNMLYSEEQIALMFYQIVSAVQHCHRYRIIHRDIKTTNILCKNTFYEPNLNFFLEHSLKLADFGEAIYCPSGKRIQGGGGTYCFMPPERVRGDSYAFKADIWSLGITLWEILTLKLPYNAKEKKDILKLIEHSPIKPEQIPLQSNEGKDLMMKLLAVDERNRPTADQLLNHPWLLGRSSETKNNYHAVQILNKKRIRQRFRTVVNLLIAGYRMRRMTTATYCFRQFVKLKKFFPTLKQVEMLYEDMRNHASPPGSLYISRNDFIETLVRRCTYTIHNNSGYGDHIFGVTQLYDDFNLGSTTNSIKDQPNELSVTAVENIGSKKINGIPSTQMDLDYPKLLADTISEKQKLNPLHRTQSMGIAYRKHQLNKNEESRTPDSEGPKAHHVINNNRPPSGEVIKINKGDNMGDIKTDSNGDSKADSNGDSKLDGKPESIRSSEGGIDKDCEDDEGLHIAEVTLKNSNTKFEDDCNVDEEFNFMEKTPTERYVRPDTSFVDDISTKRTIRPTMLSTEQTNRPISPTLSGKNAIFNKLGFLSPQTPVLKPGIPIIDDMNGQCYDMFCDFSCIADENAGSSDKDKHYYSVSHPELSTLNDGYDPSDSGLRSKNNSKYDVSNNRNSMIDLETNSHPGKSILLHGVSSKNSPNILISSKKSKASVSRLRPVSLYHHSNTPGQTFPLAGNEASSSSVNANNKAEIIANDIVNGAAIGNANINANNSANGTANTTVTGAFTRTGNDKTKRGSLNSPEEIAALLSEIYPGIKPSNMVGPLAVRKQSSSAINTSNGISPVKKQTNKNNDSNNSSIKSPTIQKKSTSSTRPGEMDRPLSAMLPEMNDMADMMGFAEIVSPGSSKNVSSSSRDKKSHSSSSRKSMASPLNSVDMDISGFAEIVSPKSRKNDQEDSKSSPGRNSNIAIKVDSLLGAIVSIENSNESSASVLSVTNNISATSVNFVCFCIELINLIFPNLKEKLKGIFNLIKPKDTETIGVNEYLLIIQGILHISMIEVAYDEKRIREEFEQFFTKDSKDMKDAANKRNIKPISLNIPSSNPTLGIGPYRRINLSTFLNSAKNNKILKMYLRQHSSDYNKDINQDYKWSQNLFLNDVQHIKKAQRGWLFCCKMQKTLFIDESKWREQFLVCNSYTGTLEFWETFQDYAVAQDYNKKATKVDGDSRRFREAENTYLQARTSRRAGGQFGESWEEELDRGVKSYQNSPTFSKKIQDTFGRNENNSHVQIKPYESIVIDDDKVSILYCKGKIDRIKIKAADKRIFLLEAKNNSHLKAWLELFSSYRCKVIYDEDDDK